MRVPLSLPLLLALAAGAPAWGPFTHQIVNQRAADALAGHPDLGFLAEGSTRDLFVRAGATGDMTFNLRSGGKTHPAVNTLLHAAPFHAHLVEVARAGEGDPGSRLAFAYGLAAHLAGDQVGNAPGGLVTHNTFGWPADADVFGDPVDHPAASAEAALRYATISINKILVDTLLRDEEAAGQAYVPHVDGDLLVEAARTYEGPGALPNDTDGEREELAALLGMLGRRFPTSARGLRLITWRIHRNRRLREGIRGELGGLDGMAESAARVRADLEDLLAGRPPAPPRAPGEAAHDHRIPDSEQAILASVIRELAGLEPGDLPFAPDGVAALKRRIYKTFFLHALVPFRSWDALVGKVRGLVPAPRPGSPGAPEERLPVLPELVGIVGP